MGQFFLQDYVYYTIFVCYNKANECKRIKFVIRNVVLVIEPVNKYLYYAYFSNGRTVDVISLQICVLIVHCT